VRDGRVGPIERERLAVPYSDVPRVQVAVQQRLRYSDRRELADCLTQLLGPARQQLPLGGFQPVGRGVRSEQPVDLTLEPGQPTVDAAEGQQPVHPIDIAALQPGMIL
jgi:hypothetical protein